MRKIITALLAVLLLAGLCTTAAAAPEALTVSAASVQTEQTVFVTVTLNTAVTADQIGLTYSYDTDMLTAIPQSSQWTVKGVLDDFNNKNEGAWADKAAKAVQGEICQLAFRAKADAKLGDTKVSVSLSLMKNGKTVEKFDAKGTVSVTCGHTFSNWTYQDPTGHTRQCSACQEVQNGSHSWDEGVLKADPQNPNASLKVITCTACGGTKEFAVEGGAHKPEQDAPTQATQESEQDQPTEPLGTVTRPIITAPTYTMPDELQTAPADTHDHDHTVSTVPPYVDYNAPEHTHEDETVSGQISGDAVATEDPHAGHDHTTTQQNNPKWVTALAVFGTMAVIVGGSVLLMKKKNW